MNWKNKAERNCAEKKVTKEQEIEAMKASGKHSPALFELQPEANFHLHCCKIVVLKWYWSGSCRQYLSRTRNTASGCQILSVYQFRRSTTA